MSKPLNVTGSARGGCDRFGSTRALRGHHNLEVLDAS